MCLSIERHEVTLNHCLTTLFKTRGNEHSCLFDSMATKWFSWLFTSPSKMEHHNVNVKLSAVLDSEGTNVTSIETAGPERESAAFNGEPGSPPPVRCSNGKSITRLVQPPSACSQQLECFTLGVIPNVGVHAELTS